MTVATRAPSVESWVQSFTEANNQDPEIQAHGKYFTCSYLLDMEAHTFVVRVYPAPSPRFPWTRDPIEVPYQFAIRASAHTWGEFGKPVPAPMYHGIWAATFQRDMKLEGDVLVLMQGLALPHPPDRTAALHRRTRLDHRSS